ncbi:MAG: hypothetical protein JWM14_884 [Chitinophagaceae bacterium]|nr:hypothetical protein [Chitinophagaceae bacterium]
MKKIKLTKYQKKRVERIEMLLGIILFVSLPFCFILGHGIENYPQWLLFILTLIAAGIVIGTIISSILHRFLPETKIYKNAKGFKLSHHIFFCSILISIGSGFLINECWEISKECKTYPIVKQSKSYYYKDHYLFIQKERTTERINFGRSFYQVHWKDKNLNLSLVTGCLGFSYYKYPCRK